ncbi:MAG: PTS fructose transporter subunit IIA [Ideonella sp. WA131b]|jgi:PTS system ascorbate-specific IIA component|nr:PTS fructose transporter subunit IIA [Ideonella sp. WA131b]
MAKIIIVAHTPLASSLQSVAAHVYPEAGGRLVAVDVAPGAGLEAVEAQVRDALAPVLAAGEEALVLVDVFGATPSNAALAAVEGARARVVAGVNVPMLWRSLCYASLPLEELVGRAVAGATQGVMHVAVSRRQNQGPAPAAHDPVQHHHQQ